MEFKRFNIVEIEQIVILFLNVFEKEPWNDNWQSFDKAKQYLMDIVNTPGFIGYVVYQNKKIIGACLGYIIKWWQGNEYFIKEFFIDNDKQGNGIGSKFYDYMIMDLQNEKIRTITLLTDKFTNAFQFYLKKGLSLSEDTVFMYQNIIK